jgi:hypothetical protein
MMPIAPRVIFLNSFEIKTRKQEIIERPHLNKVFLPYALLLAGCASTTGIVAIGKDEYMIAREDNGPAASLGAIKAATFKEAASFCVTQGKALKTLKESDTPRSFGQFPQTNLQFTCV